MKSSRNRSFLFLAATLLAACGTSTAPDSATSQAAGNGGTSAGSPSSGAGTHSSSGGTSAAGGSLGNASSGGGPMGGTGTAGTSTAGTSAGGAPSGGASAGGNGFSGANASGGFAGSANSGGNSSGAPNIGGASSGGAGGTAFRPCPTDGSACKIMPLGDSITESRQQDTGYPGGYRVELFHLALADGKKITFVGSSAHGPNGPDMVDGVAFPKDHEGHAGYDIDETGGGWGLYPTYTQAIPTTYKPHIILLMIGTNDINNNVEINNAPTRLNQLIGVLTDENPNSLLVVAEITPTQTAATNVKIQAYNAAIPDIVKKASAAGRHVLLVDMYTPFISNKDFATAYMENNLHPQQAGLAVMGQVWYEMIKGILP